MSRYGKHVSGLRAPGERALIATRDAQRVVPLPAAVDGRQITVGNRVYFAFSAHELMAAESDRNLSRPGHVE